MPNGYCVDHTNMCQGLGRLEQGMNDIKEHILRLDDRINGAFTVVNKHLDEAPERIRKITILEKTVEAITKDKINSSKAAQWRIGIIIGIICAIPSFVIAVITLFSFLAGKH